MIGFNANHIAGRLASLGYDSLRIDLHDQLKSTQHWLREHADDATASTPWLCACDWQQEGLARRGRHWQTAAGNLTFTLLTESARPTPGLMGLSLVAGMAVAETLQQVASVDAGVKWPNDVLVGDRKLCGMLIDVLPLHRESMSHHSGNTGSRVFTGIGINMVHADEHAGLGIGATSLEKLWPAQCDEVARLAREILPDDATPGRPLRDELLARVVANLLDSYALFEHSGWMAFEDRWKTVDVLKDREVVLLKAIPGQSHADANVEHAVARGVDNQGALLVETRDASGRTRTTALYSGEVTVRPVR